MATAEKLEEAFDDLGFELEDAKVKDRLASLCEAHFVDEEKLSCEYLAYLSRKKLAAETIPTLVLLDDFDLDLGKHLQTRLEDKLLIERATGKPMHTVDSPSKDAEMNLHDEDEDGALSFYGHATPSRQTSKKRQLASPEELPATRKKNGTTTSPLPFSPSSLETTPKHVGQKYSARTNAGKILVQFGDGVRMSASSWRNSSEFDVQVNPVQRLLPDNYRYMFERLRERAGYLDETICRIGDDLTEMHNLEPQNFCQVMPESFDVVGRICCDAEGRLNSKSILLQGCQDLCMGRTIPLDTSKVPGYSLFPGQIVGANVTNPVGDRLIATDIYHNASPKPTPFKTTFLASSDFHLIVACGPYTTSDNLNYEPLSDFLRYIVDHRPHVAIMCGPFVDIKHPLVESGDTGNQTFDDLFVRVMKAITEELKEVNTEVLIVPSSRDAHHKFIYPTPPFEKSKISDRIHMMSDPCIVNIEKINFGITSSDILFHLGKEEISFPPRSGDRLRRLANHILQQRSFYPLYPPNEEMNIDYEQLENIARIEEQPHVLILPSDLLHFFKDINGCLAMNPQRLVKGEGGGVFARLKVKSSNNVDTELPITKRVSCEIVRI